ncbi:hypothetical protein GGP86_003052 [Salinibacter ruber]|uniref:sulfotransferase family protein n=1 Tax=Salinibacter ruber TaxID=146919 RepID=UPI0021690AA1|nr:sulfotransferase family protein [Salinibacter ruber]MCS3863256.1 hypothetical protein [Salinibacter ruber]
MGAINKVIGDLLRRMPFSVSRIPAEIARRRVLQRARERIRSDTAAKPKVFGIGLSRTGTTSLSQALRELGYDCVHFSKGSRIIGWPEFYALDAAVDTPVSVRFESLYHTFENAKFIYTTREIENWINSVKEFFGVDKPNKLRKYWRSEKYWSGSRRVKTGWEEENAIEYRTIQESLYCRFETWEDSYHQFDSRVKSFFEDKPASKILEMNIPKGDGWERLCSFLGKKRPKIDFPHANKSGRARHPILHEEE